MKTFLAIAAAGLILAAAPQIAQARGGSAASGSPGHQFNTNGAVAGTHGASGYAPGQQYRTNGATGGLNGAAGYAPGHTK